MILEKIKKFFFNKKKLQKEFIKWFNTAYWLIKIHEKAQDYKTCILAIKELYLKYKVWINYYEQWIKKLYALENSNIIEISSKAKEKIETLQEILNILNQKLNILDKKLKSIEIIKNKLEEKNRIEIEEWIIKKQIQEIEWQLKNKNYITALTQAKKLAFDYQYRKDTLKILTKTQKLYDKEKIIKDKELQKQYKVNKALHELWIVIEEKKDLEEKNILKKINTFFKNILIKNKEKLAFIKRIKTLSKFEKLLKISWNIENISWLKIDKEEMFSVINKWLTKDIEDFKIYWFDTYGKIIWKDKIIWDNFWYYKTNNKVIFYFWDATWHWIKAWFTIAILSKLFFEYTKENLDFKELFFKINNWLKEKIKWKEFITWIFFEWDYVNNLLKIIWAGHLPMFLYKKNTWVLEKIIVWWLALWVRTINNIASIKIKELQLENNDTLVWYTDWIIEVKNINWNMFWMNLLEKSILKYCKNLTNPEKIYENILNDVNEFKWVIPFNDDVSVFIFNRNLNKDIIKTKKEFENILKEHNSTTTIKNVINNKTREELIKEIKKERYDRDLKIKLSRLDKLYKIWEFIKLKQEIIMYYKEWFVHDKMRLYLEKILEKENLIIAKKLEEKLEKKYSTLLDLFKKWEYELVIKECLDVIFKNWKI